MVQIASLGGKERTIRQIINTPTGRVTIYEPTKADVDKIMELDDFIAALNQDAGEVEDREDKDVAESTLEVSGTTIMRDLIPMLTDIEIPEDISDEELEEIISNPTMTLSMVQHALENIVTDVYTIMIMSVQNQLREANLSYLTSKLSSSSLDMVKDQATSTDEGQEVLKQIEKEESALQDAPLKSELETKSHDSSKSKMAVVKPYQERVAEQAGIDKLREKLSDDEDDEPKE